MELRHLSNDEGSTVQAEKCPDFTLSGLIPEMLKAATYNIDQETMLNENVDSVFQNQQSDDPETEKDEGEHTNLRFNFSLYKPRIMNTYRRHKIL